MRKRGMNHGVIQVGTGIATTILDAAEIIRTLTMECLGKSIDLTVNKTKFEGDMGRIATLDRAKSILHWEAQVSLHDGLARTYKWILSDMQQRGALEQGSLAENLKIQDSIACLDRYNRSKAFTKRKRRRHTMEPKASERTKDRSWTSPSDVSEKKCLISGARGDKFGARMLGEISCMFLASQDSRLEFVHIDSVCARGQRNDTCIENLLGFNHVHEDNKVIDNYFNLTFGYRSLISAPELKIVGYHGQKLKGFGYREPETKALWNNMKIDLRKHSHSLEAFNRSRCPRDGKTVALIMDGTGCNGEMKARLLRFGKPSHTSASPITPLRDAFASHFPNKCFPFLEGTAVKDSIDKSQIDIVVHIRSDNSKDNKNRDAVDAWRLFPLEYYITVINEVESDCTKKEEFRTSEWCKALKELFLTKGDSRRHYWIHTDGDTTVLKEAVNRDLRVAAGTVVHIVGKRDMGPLAAMRQMFCADVLILSYSTMSTSMGLLTRGVVLYPKRKSFSDKKLYRRHCPKYTYCQTLYGPPFDDDPYGGWTAGLGNWYAVSPPANRGQMNTYWPF
jgi:hypothetical protein